MIIAPNIYLGPDLGTESDAAADMRAKWFDDKFRNAVVYTKQSNGMPDGDWFSQRRWQSVVKNHRRKNRHLDHDAWKTAASTHRDAALYVTAAPKVTCHYPIRIAQLDTSPIWSKVADNTSVTRDVESFTDILQRLTYRCEVVQIKDPFIKLTGEASHDWILWALGNSAEGVSRRIVFHVAEPRREKFAEFEENLFRTEATLRQWVTECRKATPLSCAIQVWSTFHDRHLITERHVVQVAHGFGLEMKPPPGKQRTTWSIENERAAEVLRNEMDPGISREAGWAIHKRTIEI